MRLAVRGDVERAVAGLAARYDAQLVAQQKLADRWRFLSPAVALNAALQDVSGTGGQRYRQFSLSVDRYLELLQGFYEPRVVRRAALTASDVRRLHDFTRQEEPAAAVARRVHAGLVLLLLAAGVVAMTGLVLLARTRPTGA